MSILSFIEKFTRKQFSDTEKTNILGTVLDSHLAYAADEKLRERSASGGVVTGLLLHLLESGKIDGALVTEGYVEEQQFKTRFIIAKNQDELLRSQGSKYATVHFNRDAMPLLREFKGKLAVVALPCDTTNFRRMCEKDPELNEKVAAIITLFCGHLSQPELTQHIIEQHTRDHESPLVAFQHRTGHWRGEMSLKYADGSEEHPSFSRFSTYQNLYFFSEEKCLHCHDHFGYDGDISAGDLWHSSMKDNSIKMTALLSRTQLGNTILREAIESGVLKAREVTTDLLLEGHARSVRGHYNISARAKAGKILGFKFRDNIQAKVNLWDWLTAFIILVNYHLSTKKWGRKLILKMPKPVWIFYLYLFKGIESL